MLLTQFENREDAGHRLADRLRGLPVTNPLVLAIPRGGIEIALPIARRLPAELDIVLARKLRAPNQPELALGAISETGEVYLDPRAEGLIEASERYVDEERRRQMSEIERRRRLFRQVRPQARVADRTVIVTDDGIATGSTMIAALRAVRAGGAGEVVMAVPVAARERLEEIRPLCERVVCLIEADFLWAIGQFYREFEQVSDERVLEVLREFASPRPASGPPARGPLSGVKS
ncbi:MAG TPA: phosphoribosyltransferase family protein [Candidatus Sulfotelmatobacter sp.]|nr:phosphoribosyltransferase family protein [Candidatus Sulfotelmatobacter sp.]